MKILQINSVVNLGSTGHIAEDIGQKIIDNGWESYIAYGRLPRESNSKLIRIGGIWNIYFHGIQTRLFDKHGLGSDYDTKILVKKIIDINPDIIHLHNIHGYYLNIRVLFDYLSIANIPVVWTLHDCWSFTGHCVHFEFVGCEKWKTECYSCPQKKQYPASYLIDRSKKNFHLKKSLFTSVEKMMLVPVSNWLAGLLKVSFFSKTKFKTIHNGINTSIFRPQLNQFETKSKYNLGNKFIILGVARPWSKRKGYDDFLKLSKYLSKDEIIVLVGLNERQMKNLTPNILGLRKTENQQQMVDLYNAADIFINPTWEDNFPTTNLEALACGTPVATYNTGGSIESVTKETGFIVEKGNLKALWDVVNTIKKNGKAYYSDECRKRAVSLFDMNDQFSEYINLYKEILNHKNKSKI